MTLKEKISDELSVNSLKDRVNPKTIAPFWLKVFEISGIVAAIGTGVLTAGASLPATVLLTTKIVTVSSGVVSLGSFLDKSNPNPKAPNKYLVSKVASILVQIFKKIKF